MAKAYYARCTKVGIKTTKEQYETREWCSVMGKVTACNECGFSEQLHHLG